MSNIQDNLSSTGSQIIVYKKDTLDKVVDLLDKLHIQGHMISNAQIINSILQILQTQGTVQSLNCTDGTHETGEQIHES